MRAVDIRELKKRLTHYLQRAKKGEVVIVTTLGCPVAVLQPLEHAVRTATGDGRLALLAARRIVTLPTRKGFARTRPIRVAGPPVSKTILEDRR